MCNPNSLSRLGEGGLTRPEGAQQKPNFWDDLPEELRRDFERLMQELKGEGTENFFGVGFTISTVRWKIQSCVSDDF